jgi:hypothetical protein
MATYACNECGALAYFDGRCGDGPVLLCGCDRKGPVAYDSRIGGGRGNAYHPAATARPVEVDSDYKPPRPRY